MNADFSKKPKLAVGQVWKNGAGQFVVITHCREEYKRPWAGSDGRVYRDDGRFLEDGHPCAFDLVELQSVLQSNGDCSHQGLQAVLNKHKAIFLRFKVTSEPLKFEYSSAKELDDCIVFYGTNLASPWGSTSVFYKSEIVCMHFSEGGSKDE